MGKILILKDESTDFEKYVSNFFRDNGVTTKKAYNRFYYNHPMLWKLVRKINLNIFTYFFLYDWKTELSKYEKVIVFDNCVSRPLLKYLDSIYGISNVSTWLWNVELTNIDWIKKRSLVYCFDKIFCDQHNVLYLPQFYFKNGPDAAIADEKKQVFFIGQDKGRIPVLRQIASYLKSINVDYSIIVCSKNHDDDHLLSYIDTNLSYEDVIDKVRQSSIILEVTKNEQTGLTLRALEALFYQKKLITNNRRIREEKMYSKENVFILGEDSIEELRGFIESKYHKPCESVYKYYSFNEWLKNISE